MTLSESCNVLEWQGPIEWGAPERRVLARETRTIDMSARPKSPTSSTSAHSLEPTDWDIVIGPTRHAYFTVRMADGLRIVDGGNIVDADGRRLGSGHQRQLRRMGRYVCDGPARSAKWV